jgi:hypothetical protein
LDQFTPVSLNSNVERFLLEEVKFKNNVVSSPKDALEENAKNQNQTARNKVQFFQRVANGNLKRFALV